MKNNSLIVSFLAIILFSSCKEKIDLNLNNQEFSRLVVEGTITNEDIYQTIMITKTSDYSKSQPPVIVHNAIVSVSDGQNSWSFSESASGIYQSQTPFQGMVGMTYNLSIQYDNESYTAVATMNPALIIDTLYAATSAYGDSLYEIYSNIYESEMPMQYYLLKTIVNGVINDSLKNWNYFSDELINGAYLPDLLLTFVKAKEGDTIQIKSFSINKEHYDYIINASQSLYEPIPFLGSNPANIKGNISNGAMGFFQASAVSVNSCVIQ
ncbi:MAG: hypothetical protein CVU05_13395 [Bacteroidetes bacterium HGW-Bacteroidetes-21]|jgi:hypothetical protein|nr:MAG: hypothetical protein CVU05_13395 [Bacteroidetes bacterium HGW-Bacteroidetes-21]